MQYENPKFDESKNPNVTHDPYQLGELRALLGYLLVTLVAVWLLIEMIVFTLPRTISLERERQWFQFIGAKIIIDERTSPDPELQKLADQLAVHMKLPPKSVSVYISEQNIPNAYATFGGNIVLYRGLLNRLKHEESVAAVLAHEMAHIKHRDPLRSMSRSLFYSAVAAAFGSDSQMQKLATLEGLRYSRDLEEQADNRAIFALAQHYQNVNGMILLFQTLQQIEQDYDMEHRPTWLTTHPDTASRVQNVHDRIQQFSYHNTPAQHPNRWQKTLPKTSE